MMTSRARARLVNHRGKWSAGEAPSVASSSVNRRQPRRPTDGHTTITPSVQRPRIMFSAASASIPNPNHAIASVANHVMPSGAPLRIIPASVLRQIIVQQRREKEPAQHGQDDDVGIVTIPDATPSATVVAGQRRQRQQHHRRDHEFEEIHSPPIGGLREEHRQRAVRILLSDGLRADGERSDHVGKQPEQRARHQKAVTIPPDERGGKRGDAGPPQREKRPNLLRESR